MCHAIIYVSEEIQYHVIKMKMMLNYLIVLNTAFVKVFWSKTYFIVPVNCEWVKSERFEVVQILQLLADSLLHQWREIHKSNFSIAECDAQCIVSIIFSFCYCQQY